MFSLRRQGDGYRLLEDMEFHFLELPKMRALKRSPRTPLEKWLYYLSNAEGETMDQIAEEIPMIQKARMCEELFAQMDHERRLYDLREKGLHDMASSQKHARQEGHKEGMKEALWRVAQNMLREDMPPALVAKVTELSPDDVAGMGD